MIYQQLDQLGGLNTNLSPFLHAPNMPTILNGINISHKLGAMLKDVGYQKKGATLQSGKSVLGLFDFKQSGGNQKMLATLNDSGDNDTQLFYKTDAGAWTEIGAAETAWANVAGTVVSMEAFLDYCFFTGYSSVDGFLPVGSLTGTTFSTVTNVTGMASGKQVIRYRDRLYVINCRLSGTNYPFRVYFSSVPTAGAITWTNTDFLDVDYSEELVGAGVNWDRMMVFTEDNAYMYDQTYFKKVWAVGCSNWRTIKNSGEYMIWTDKNGIWISTGGQPMNIGGSVIDFIRAGDPRNFFAEVVDEEYHLYVGTVTVNGITYTNCSLRLNIPTSTFTTREHADNLTSFAKKNNSGTDELYMGATSGEVFQKGKHSDSTLLTTDAGADIKSNFELAPIHLSSLSLVKGGKGLTAYAERGQGLQLKWRALDRNSQVLTQYKTLGELKKYINSWDVSSVEAALIQIAGDEYGSDPYWSFYGFEIELEQHSTILKPNYP